MSTDIPPAAKYPSDPYYYKADRGAQLASLFFLLFLVFLLLLCIYCFCRWCGQQRQHRAAALMSILSGDADVQVHELDNDPGLNSSVIASLPTFTHRKRSSSHKNSEGPERTLECAVCLGAIEEGEVGRLLPSCSHVFHVECIDKWLGVNSTCPVCRGKVVSVKEATAAGAVDADRQGAETTTSSGMRIPADELSDVGDVTESEAASTDGSVVTAEIGSTSQLVSLFRKMVGRD